MTIWRRAPSILRRCLWAALPFLLFGIFFHWRVLDPTRIHWTLADDWGQHVLGWQAWRHTPLAWPFNHEFLLAPPAGLSLLYTDSNPPMAFLFRLLSPLLPPDVQYLGLWFLACLILQVLFAWLLVRRHAPGPWAAMAGALLLCALPTLYNRMNHDTLMAHWLILAGLYIYLEWRGRRTRWLAWSALLGFAGLLHPYLLVMVTAIWAGDVWRAAKPFWQADDIKGAWHALPQCALPQCALPVCAAIAGLAIAGAFGGGQSPGADGFGIYSMGLDAPFNPGLPAFSALIKAHAGDEGQMSEGFQYLGAGLLFLLACALVLYALDRPAPGLAERIRPLFVPLLVLFLLALSCRIQFYDHVIFRVSIPDPVKPLFSVVRASGRFFWPIAYLLVWTALIVIFASPRRWTIRILPLALLIQAADLHGFARYERERTREADTAANFVLTPAPQWDALIRAARRVDIYPPQPHIDDRLFYEIAWRSVSANVPVNTMYAARPSLSQMALDETGRQAVMAGRIDPERLYVLLNPCNIPAAAERMRELDGVWIIPPARAQNVVTARPAPQVYRLDETFTFGWRDKGACLTGPGFAMPEKNMSWDMAPVAHLGLDLARPIPAGAVLHLRLHGGKRACRVTILINGAPVGGFTTNSDTTSLAAPLPASLTHARHLDIAFVAGNALRRRGDGTTPVFALEALRLESLHVTSSAG